MSLLYKTAKWDKQLRDYKKIKAIELSYKNIYTHTKLYLSPDEVISKSKSKFVRPIKDLMSVYYQLGNDYFRIAESSYMFGDNKLSIESLYRHLVYRSEAYKNYDGKAENLGIVHEIQVGKYFNRLMCTAILFDEYERVAEFSHFSKIISAIYKREYEKAAEYVNALPDNVDDRKEVYYINNAYLKTTFSALLSGDEKNFKKSIEERVKKLRKNSAGYLTAIDIISLALIKLSRERDMNFDINVIEIPLDFIEEAKQFDKNRVEIELFKKIYFPTEM